MRITYFLPFEFSETPRACEPLRRGTNTILIGAVTALASFYQGMPERDHYLFM